MKTSDINAARDIVSRARGALAAADDDIGMEEYDVALDHLRIARETITRAETAVRGLIAGDVAQLASDETSERVGM